MSISKIVPFFKSDLDGLLFFCLLYLDDTQWGLFYYFESRMETFLVFSLGKRTHILTIIGKSNHFQVPLVDERKRGHWLEGGISTSFHWPMENKFKEESYVWLLKFMPFCLCWKGRTYDLERKFGKKEVLDWGGGENVMIKQIFTSLEIIFGLFVLNSRSLDCSNGLVQKL